MRFVDLTSASMLGRLEAGTSSGKCCRRASLTIVAPEANGLFFPSSLSCAFTFIVMSAQSLAEHLCG